MKGGKREQINQGLQDPCKFLRFLFALYISELELKTLATQKYQQVQTTKAPTKAGFLQPKDEQRSSRTRKKMFKSNNLLLAKHGKTYSPSPTVTSKSQVESLDFQPAEVTRPPNLKHWFRERLRREPGFSSLPENNEAIFF